MPQSGRRSPGATAGGISKDQLACSQSKPIFIIKKKGGGHGGHHGGAWKVAYADFVTAMMSLFIVLWLMNTSQKVRQAVAGYFNDPRRKVDA